MQPESGKYFIYFLKTKVTLFHLVNMVGCMTDKSVVLSGVQWSLGNKDGLQRTCWFSGVTWSLKYHGELFDNPERKERKREKIQNVNATQTQLSPWLPSSMIKGEVSPNNNVDWVSRSNFTNLTVKVWADLDNPFNRSDYAKLCMSPSLDGILPEYVISQEDNFPLTLYIDF